MFLTKKRSEMSPEILISKEDEQNEELIRVTRLDPIADNFKKVNVKRTTELTATLILYQNPRA